MVRFTTCTAVAGFVLLFTTLEDPTNAFVVKNVAQRRSSTTSFITNYDGVEAEVATSTKTRMPMAMTTDAPSKTTKPVIVKRIDPVTSILFLDDSSRTTKVNRHRRRNSIKKGSHDMKPEELAKKAWSNFEEGQRCAQLAFAEILNDYNIHDTALQPAVASSAYSSSLRPVVSIMEASSSSTSSSSSSLSQLQKNLLQMHHSCVAAIFRKTIHSINRFKFTSTVARLLLFAILNQANTLVHKAVDVNNNSNYNSNQGNWLSKLYYANDYGSSLEVAAATATVTQFQSRSMNPIHPGTSVMFMDDSSSSSSSLFRSNNNNGVRTRSNMMMISDMDSQDRTRSRSRGCSSSRKPLSSFEEGQQCAQLAIAQILKDYNIKDNCITP